MGPWSYSHLEKFETCPRQFFEVKVAKNVVEPPTEATIWGKSVHDAFERRVRDGTPLPDGMDRWEPLAASILRLPGVKHTEIKLAIDRAFQPTEWDTAWSRGIADLLVLSGRYAAVLDYKTGKPKPSEQLALYAAYVLALYPKVESVSTGFVWLRDEKIVKETFTRSSISATWQELLPRVSKLEAAFKRQAWPARPSGLCRRHCPVRSCEHNGSSN